MAQEKVKILGISGSPRREANTATMVKYCLEYAKEMGYIETEYLSLADYKLVPCTGCMKCFGYMAPADDPYQCYDSNDDIKILAPKVAACDGLLIGFPVYTGGVPSLLRILMEKLHHFAPMSFTRHAGALKWKAAAIISQGGAVYGGQELNNRILAAGFSSLGMYVVNAWPTVDSPQPQSTFTSGILTTIDGTAIYGKGAWTKEGVRTIPPVTGIRNERTLRNLGRQLAVGAMVMKLGREAFLKAGYKEPEYISFTKYSLRPKPGSYIDKLVKEGKVTYISPEELEARKKQAPPPPK